MNFKKMVSLVLSCLLMSATLLSCGEAKGKTLAEVRKEGKLVIATSPDFPPFEGLEDGAVVGIEIDIMNAICEELGVELVIEQMAFDSVLPGLIAGKYDVGVSGITVTEKRLKNSLFTDAYCMAEQSIVVTSDSPITCKADLDGKTVSVQTGTTAESFCGENNYVVEAFEANSDARAALLRDGDAAVDAWVIDDLTAKSMVEEYNAEHPDAPLVILDEAMTQEPYAFAFAFGSEDLVEKVNEILTDLKESGKMEEIFAKFDAKYVAPSANS